MKNVRKAIFAGLAALGSSIGTAALDGVITEGEWWLMAGAVLVAAGGTFQIRNGDKPSVEAR